MGAPGASIRALRCLAAALVLTLAVMLTPTQIAAGETCPEAAFTDRDAIPAAHVGSVDCAVDHGIISGYPDSTYRPAVAVRRDQMAAFLARTLRAGGVSLPQSSGDRFDDLEGNPHRSDIERLAEAGVVAGHSERSFRPALHVRRDQMASLLLRAVAFGRGRDISDLQSDDRAFDDVAPGNAHFRNVNGAAEQGLVSGASGRYRPGAATRRDQMASLVMRVLRHLEGDPQPPLARPPVTFSSETIDVGATLWSAAIGDVTGDDRNDVLVTSGDGNDARATSLFLLAGRSDGTLRPVRAFGLSGQDVCCNARQMGIAIGNLRGDATNEVAVATARGIDVLRWDGSGLVVQDTLAVSGIPQHVRLADLEGDGDTDVLVRMGDRPQVGGDIFGGVVALVRSGQGYREQRIIEVSQHWQGALEVADLNSDGRVDIAMTHSQLVVALQSAGGGFAVSSTPLRAYARGLTFTNVDGAGGPDAVLTYADNSPTSMEVLANDGSGGFGEVRQYETCQLPNTIKAADLDGIGGKELAVMHSGGYSRLGTYAQQDGGLAAEELHEVPDYNATHHFSDAMALGDITGDGRPDVVAADGERILIMRNTTGSPR